MSTNKAVIYGSVLGEFFEYKEIICQVKGVVLVKGEAFVLLDKTPTNNQYGIPVMQPLADDKSLNERFGISDRPLRGAHQKAGLAGIPLEWRWNHVAVPAKFFLDNATCITGADPLNKQIEPGVAERIALVKRKDGNRFIVPFTEPCVGGYGTVTGVFIDSRKGQLAFTAEREGKSIHWLVPKRRGKARDFFRLNAVSFD